MLIFVPVGIASCCYCNLLIGVAGITFVLKDGEQHGRYRQYNKDGVITGEWMFENGKQVKRIK